MESALKRFFFQRQVCERQWNAFHSSASLDALKNMTSEFEETGDDENIACPSCQSWGKSSQGLSSRDLVCF